MTDTLNEGDVLISYRMSPEEDKAWQDNIDQVAKSVDPLNTIVGDWCTVDEFMKLVDLAQKAIRGPKPPNP